MTKKSIGRISSKFRRLPSFSFYFLKLTLNRKKKIFKVYNKSVRLVFFFVRNSLKFLLYNGRFLRIYIFKKNMVFYRFGEFIFTRRFGKGEIIHAKKKKVVKK